MSQHPTASPATDRAAAPAAGPAPADPQPPAPSVRGAPGFSRGAGPGAWSGVTRRLLLGFGALVVTFAVASYLVIAGLGRIQGAMARIEKEEAGVRLALELASAVRDQYAHQAHTIIIGNESHLAFYGEAERHVLELTRDLRARVHGEEQRAAVKDIERASAELDALFRQRIVPAVVRGDRAYVQLEHGQAQLVVTRIQERTEQLVTSFQQAITSSRAEAAAVQRRTYRYLLLLLLGAPLLAAAVTYLIGRSIARPLHALRGGAARIAAGDLDTRIPVLTRDELGALAAQFNGMAAALKEHQQRLVESEKLAGIGRLAAGVAHEINNPLAVILGYARLLERGADDAARADLAVIEQETLRAREIVAGLLDLSRPQEPPPADPVDLRQACDEVVVRLREAGLLDGVVVAVAGTASAPGDAARLRQVLSNLVRNAAEAAGAGGHVEVAVSGAGGEVLVTVADDGPGLDDRARDRLFEPFFTTKERGTGLGLAISRAIARAHGGELEAANRPGRGAVFTLRLPSAAAGGAP
jgi:two-component system, NtrC family, sensor kinase